LTLLVNEKTLISTEILMLNGVKVFSSETCWKYIQFWSEAIYIMQGKQNVIKAWG
jgi:hypothetical protein